MSRNLLYRSINDHIEKDIDQCESSIQALRREWEEDHDKFVNAMLRKDEMIKEMVKDTMTSFKEMVRETNESNDKNIQKLVAQLNVDIERDKDNMSRLEKRMDIHDESPAQVMGKLLKENAVIKDWKNIGENLMPMVNQSEQELDQKYGDVPSILNSNPATGFASQSIGKGSSI